MNLGKHDYIYTIIGVELVNEDDCVNEVDAPIRIDIKCNDIRAQRPSGSPFAEDPWEKFVATAVAEIHKGDREKLKHLHRDILGNSSEQKVLACLEMAEKLICCDRFTTASVLLNRAIEICEEFPQMKPTMYYHDSVFNLAQMMMNGHLSPEENERGLGLMQQLVREFPDCEEAKNYV